MLIIWHFKVGSRSTTYFEHILTPPIFWGTKYVGPPRNIIRGILWCLTPIAMIFKFGNVNGPMAAKWPKVNRGLKIVNYFTCMRHFSCRWYRPPEVAFHGIDTQGSLTHIAMIFKFRNVNGPMAAKWPKVNCMD